MEAKFEPLIKDKKHWHQSRWNFSEEQPVHPFIPQKEWRNFGRVESGTIWLETKKTETKLAATCKKNEQQQQDAKHSDGL